MNWDKKKFKHISIIIAILNEEENLKALLHSLKQLNYPQEFYEVILVNDNSTDNSSKIITEEISGLSNFRLIEATDKKLPAKKGVLDIGIAAAKYDLIALTDGDCIVEPDWLTNIADALENNDLVFGPAPLTPTEGLVSRFASYEAQRTQIVNYFTQSIGIPVSATGRNIAYRKSLIIELGGYESTMDKLSGDDDLIVREALKQNKKIGIINPNGARVFSNTVQSWKDYFLQKSRHVSTSHNYLLKQQSILALWFISNLAVTFSIFFSAENLFFLFPLFLKLRFDVAAVKKYPELAGKDFKIHEIIFYEIIYNFSLIINFINSLFYKDKWK
jgi:cellulose synthase/poly-beta-1,6-N-acetylglucosamine synthase-like glycosyltransferase